MTERNNIGVQSSSQAVTSTLQQKQPQHTQQSQQQTQPSSSQSNWINSGKRKPLPLLFLFPVCCLHFLLVLVFMFMCYVLLYRIGSCSFGPKQSLEHISSTQLFIHKQPSSDLFTTP